MKQFYEQGRKSEERIVLLVEGSVSENKVG
jgi:hypothetical protein